MNKNLILVESPNKIMTLKNILKDTEFENAIILATVGNFVRINDSGQFNLGIDIHNNFLADFVVDSSKRDIIEKI